MKRECAGKRFLIARRRFGTVGFVSACLVFSQFVCCVAAIEAAEVIAHRGASAYAPENTVSSVERAWELGADLAEIDIHLTSDGHIVVIHDKDTGRVSSVCRKVSKCTLAELRSIDVGSWKGPEFAGERIPTLDEVLATVPDGRRIVIEIKCGGDIVQKLEAAITRSGLDRRQVVVVSFDYDIVKEFKSRNTDIEVCLLKKIRRNLITRRWKPSAEKLARKALAAGLDGVDVKAVEAVDASYVRKVKSAGLRFYVYTVDDPERAAELARIGVDGITTNVPDVIRRRIAEVE